MYLEHFGLRETPFRITPHADFFFGGANRSALLEALVHALSHEEGLIKISGEVGTGKTMLARVLTERLPGHLRAVYLADPLMNRGELLAVLADELQCPRTDGTDAGAHRLLRTVQEALVAEFAAGRQVALLIDEAHAMPAETLEQIRLLSNLESERHKLIKIVLFGQPELDDLLARPDMRQLKDRITQHFRLDPMQPAEVVTYMDFRMRAAGYRGPPVFEAAASARIARDAGGLTRRVNVLADKALLSAFARGAHAVTAADAARAAADTQMRARRPAAGRPARIAVGALLVALLLGAGFLLGRFSSAPAAAVDAAPATAAALAGPPAMQAPADPAPAAANAPPSPSLAMPASAADDDADPLQQLLATSREWTRSAPGERWFIQLMSVPAAQSDNVLTYLRRARRSLDPQWLRAYRTDDPADAQLAVIYGDFADQRSALQALAALPDWITRSQPIARQVRSLRPP
jgi:MSHA biogenesis protein MshM